MEKAPVDASDTKKINPWIQTNNPPVNPSDNVVAKYDSGFVQSQS
jgi:hypothetical protein